MQQTPCQCTKNAMQRIPCGLLFNPQRKENALFFDLRVCHVIITKRSFEAHETIEKEISFLLYSLSIFTFYLRFKDVHMRRKSMRDVKRRSRSAKQQIGD